MKLIPRFLLLILLMPLFSCSKGDVEANVIRGYVKVVDDISNVSISDLVEDSEGFIWISTTSNGLFRYDGSSYLQFASDLDNPSSISSSYVNDILVDKKGDIWIATQKGIDRYEGDFVFSHINSPENNNYCIEVVENNAGQIYALTRMAVWVYSPETNSFRRCFRHVKGANVDPHMFFDKSDNLWIKYDNSVICYDKSLTQRASFEFGESNLLTAFDGENTILIAESNKLHFIDTYKLEEVEPLRTLAGVAKERVYNLANINDNLILLRSNLNSYCYDCKTRVLYNGESDNNLYSSVISVISNKYLYDRNGDIWTISNRGLVFHRTETDPFVGKVHLDNFLRQHSSSASATDGNFVWYYTKDDYLVSYDRGAKKIVSRIHFSDYTKESLLNSKLNYSSDGYLILASGTRKNQTAYLFEVKENGIPRLVTSYRGKGSLVPTFDNDGNLWFGGIGCYYKVPKPDGKKNSIDLEEVPIEGIDDLSYANYVTTLRNGDILFCYSDNTPFTINPKTGVLAKIDTDIDLPQVYYQTGFEDSVGNVWIGTSDHGLFVKTPSSSNFVHVNELGLSDIRSIQQDKEGNVFILTDYSQVYFVRKGENKFEPIWRDVSDIPEEKTLVTMPDKMVKLLANKNLIPLSVESTSNGELVNYPLSIVVSSDKTPVTSFMSSELKNNSITVNLGDLRESMFLRLAVVGQTVGTDIFNYHYVVNGSKAKLAGSLNNPVIPLQNLRRGRNVVHFRVTNDSTMQQSPIYTLVLKTNLSFAVLLGIIAFAILCVIAAALFYAQKRKQADVDKERKQRELQEEINIKNIDFFANISHEFRTPLTIINGAAGVLESSTSTSSEKDNAVGVIRRNAGRMLKLVGQMLDFNKLDHDMLKLSVKMEDIPSIINHVVENFTVGANVKNIDLITEGCELPVLGFIDADKLEKILYNLLSNAFKFTSPGGSIVVSAKFDDNLTLKVSDSGIGIREDKISTLFDRFTQIDPSKKTGGTGIGLYYCKALTELHHGTIGVANRYEAGSEDKSAGAVFTVVIPVLEGVYSEEEKSPREDTNVSVDKTDYSVEIVSADTPATEQPEKPTIVIVDDDYEIVHFLKNLFSPYYNVIYRFDAMSGYNKIEESHPDLIVCDYMMVDMDGLELCRMVKDNMDMSHIPFIMLTAKSSLQDQLDSLNSGADAYVSKPFNPDYLLALIKSQLENRNRMKKVLSTSVETPKDETGKRLSAMDKEFMDTVYDIMEKNLEDGQLDIDQVAEMIGVSRSKFYYKLKALTDQTPNEFFTSYKLNRAKELLEEGRYKISAIANIVGFNSGSHFANLFKKKFGMLPSQYQEEHIKSK